MAGPIPVKNFPAPHGELGDFAAAYKLSAQVENDISGGGLPFASDWFMEFPNIRMMQAGWRVGLDVYEMHLQDQAANKLAKTFFK